MPTKDSAVITIRVPVTLRDAIDQEAHRRHLSRNRLVVMALDAFFFVGSESRETGVQSRVTGGQNDDTLRLPE